MTMTDEHPGSAHESPYEEIQQVPLVLLRDEPAAAAARERLLQAIGREADAVADLQPGNAAGALAELARAYALITSTETTTTAALSAPAPAGRTAPDPTT
ncbi:hypothetical protein NDR87_22375 [Nocardia sp. CDC159]|uniref:Uncharacterized protein n=1 Tax=Nocardia pulmonis TaxID=2951408 RepID=A0A9X2ECI3_9NOCA|nr:MULTISPECIES: hypothetical protein [Nocardia]MCM6776733.1 hypothetical protein [Nocardia pulmonis]MCM6789118.1 hypothetical protein [Nocardia sp. CDC159]